MVEDLHLKIEALLFGAEEPVDVPRVQELVGVGTKTEITQALERLQREYGDRAMEITQVNGGRWMMRTKPTYAQILQRYYLHKPKTLSKLALETLSIIAYRQPVTRQEINTLRKADSSSVLLSLQEKGLIEVSGVRKALGHPCEFRTTEKFLTVFGLDGLHQLPQLKNLQTDPQDRQEMGEALKRIEKEENIGYPCSPDTLF